MLFVFSVPNKWGIIRRYFDMRLVRETNLKNLKVSSYRDWELFKYIHYTKDRNGKPLYLIFQLFICHVLVLCGLSQTLEFHNWSKFGLLGWSAVFEPNSVIQRHFVQAEIAMTASFIIVVNTFLHFCLFSRPMSWIFRFYQDVVMYIDVQRRSVFAYNFQSSHYLWLRFIKFSFY